MLLVINRWVCKCINYNYNIETGLWIFTIKASQVDNNQQIKIIKRLVRKQFCHNNVFERIVNLVKNLETLVKITMSLMMMNATLQYDNESTLRKKDICEHVIFYT